ncbi:hypothetical protein BDC45DRAFT_541351 [Circinella umbellata]|nr:hypothetical protein BDC45DRAFT_541351 [Circinella umbellata]
MFPTYVLLCIITVEAKRSDAFVTYTASVERSSPSVRASQTAIRTSPILPRDIDWHLHEDYGIAEKLLNNFIDLIQVPRKVLESRCLEGSAACLMTVYIVNTLVTPKNDSIDFRCYCYSTLPDTRISYLLIIVSYKTLFIIYKILVII